jgi:hypothetical protein
MLAAPRQREFLATRRREPKRLVTTSVACGVDRRALRPPRRRHPDTDGMPRKLLRDRRALKPAAIRHQCQTPWVERLKLSSQRVPRTWPPANSNAVDEPQLAFVGRSVAMRLYMSALVPFVGKCQI